MADQLRQSSAQRDWSLDVLRVIAILGVVSIHTFGALMTDPRSRAYAGSSEKKGEAPCAFLS